MSVMRNISVPWGTPDPEHPNISPTWWRTLIDQKNGVYYFDSALSPQMVWVNLNQIDLKSGAVACAPSRLKAMRRCRAT